jgi:hypothetical protein
VVWNLQERRTSDVKKTTLLVALMAMVVLMALGACDDGSTDAHPDVGVSVCANSTEKRPASDTLISDFDSLVTENWAADGTVVELVADGGSTVFHWATGTAASSTLVWPSAMLNTEDASLCTDAAAFSGIQLDIRGSVATTGPDYYGANWTNTISVGVVSAPTYPIEYGGDALANCGNYFWAVPITSDWQTVVLDFADVQAPWNIGVCPDVTSLPVDQIMGISFSIDSTYTAFDIYVDNVAFK